ncbi:hypothetical protein EN811_28990, partial [bacterium M00.F.Ca.ET.168.01.1.1]
RTRDNVPFVWLTLPDPWLSGTFKNACLAQGVLIDDEDEFKAGRSEGRFERHRLDLAGPGWGGAGRGWAPEPEAGLVAAADRRVEEKRAAPAPWLTASGPSSTCAWSFLS